MLGCGVGVEEWQGEEDWYECLEILVLSFFKGWMQITYFILLLVQFYS